MMVGALGILAGSALVVPILAAVAISIGLNIAVLELLFNPNATLKDVAGIVSLQVGIVLTAIGAAPAVVGGSVSAFVLAIASIVVGLIGAFI